MYEKRDLRQVLMIDERQVWPMAETSLIYHQRNEVLKVYTL